MSSALPPIDPAKCEWCFPGDPCAWHRDTDLSPAVLNRATATIPVPAGHPPAIRPPAAASAQAAANAANTAAAGASTAAAAAQNKANTAATAAAAAQATADANATAMTALAARVAKLEAQAVTGTRGRKSQPISLAIGATMDIVIPWDRAMPVDTYASVAWIAPNASSLTLLGNLAMIYPAKSQTTTTATFTVKNTGLLALSGTAVVEALATTNGIT